MKIAQANIIKRQILELQGLKKKDAFEMQNRMRRLFHDQLLPILDRYLNQLGSVGRIIRIEKLELELGNIDIYNFEFQLKTQLERKLQDQIFAWRTSGMALAEKEASAHLTPPSETAGNRPLEILQHFVQRGTLPWWLDASQADPVLESLNHFMDSDPAGLAKALQRWLSNPIYLRRLIRHLSTKDLVRLAGLRVSLSSTSSTASIKHFFQFSDALAAELGLPAARFEEEIKIKLLQLAFLQEEPISDTSTYWEVLLLQLAVVFRLKYVVLLRKLHALLQKPVYSAQGKESVLKLIAVQLMEENKSRAAMVKTESQPLDSALLLANRKQLDAFFMRINGVPFSPNALEKLGRQLRTGTIPEQLRKPLLIFVETVKRGHFDAEVFESQIIPLMESWIPDHPAEKPLIPSTMPEPVAFNQSDELFTNNAGLVLLWPYLPRFFQSLQLMENQAFPHEQAAHRAVGILQYLADGQLELPEYRVGFNKILCGLPLETVLDFGEPIRTSEMEECENLLQAVIANTPILGEMSVDGFRGSFLLRTGMLRSIADGWQLNVENESYDVVMEKFPWSWKVIKLPWLEKVIIVEW